MADPAAGGTCVFVGTVHDHSDHGEVTGLASRGLERAPGWRTGSGSSRPKCWVDGRCAGSPCSTGAGELAVGEISVVVAVSAPHRAEAFDACHHAIERLKHDVPIWKKESLAEGDAHWVMGA